MSIQSEITRIISYRDQSFSAVRNKGVVVPSNAVINDLPTYIGQIEQSGGTIGVSQDSEGYIVLSSNSVPIGTIIAYSSDAAGGSIAEIQGINLMNDTVVASALMSGYTAHDSSGQAIVGSYVPSGGGYTAEEIAKGTAPVGRIELTSGTLPSGSLWDRPITSFFGPNSIINQYGMRSCTQLTTAVINKLTSWSMSALNGCINLTIVDIIEATPIPSATFNSSSKLNIIILRGTTLSTLSYTNAFDGTPFKSGGTGGTIYIPKSLYDHLGDGSSLDYKAASNWSTINGYGTITWAKIEGSYYETHYADGTLITT